VREHPLELRRLLTLRLLGFGDDPGFPFACFGDHGVFVSHDVAHACLRSNGSTRTAISNDPR
jgi:hypothetical protein